MKIKTDFSELIAYMEERKQMLQLFSDMLNKIKKANEGENKYKT